MLKYRLKNHYGTAGEIMKTIIIGLGKTGLSVARFLARQGEAFSVCDTRSEVPGLSEFKKDFPGVDVFCGELNAEYLKQADRLVVSPGVWVKTPAILEAQEAGVEIIGDIELFAREARAPIIAITGSNGKTTVTTLMGEMARASGFNVGVGGNIGTPALDLLLEPHDLYVLELSSFQLETTYSLKAAAAVVLNVSEDHMDRYDSSQAYIDAKLRVYEGAGVYVFNQDEPCCNSELASGSFVGWAKERQRRAHHSDAEESVGTLRFAHPTIKNLTFSIENQADFYLKDHHDIIGNDGMVWLTTDDLHVTGTHHVANFLACFALGSALKFSKEAMITVAKQFHGYPHRCQKIAEKNGVAWINDSKGTNIGASVTALKSIGDMITGKIVLIAGGDGKSADFSIFSPFVEQYCRAIVLLGKDAELIEKALSPSFEKVRVNTLQEAVLAAKKLAKNGDVVLLSPACSSLDMFKNYEDRGEQFIVAVKGL